jgi:hypothetical protein
MTKAERIQKYHDEAKRMREAAKHFSAPDTRNEAEKIAAQYDSLAKSVDIVRDYGPR